MNVYCAMANNVVSDVDPLGLEASAFKKWLLRVAFTIITAFSSGDKPPGSPSGPREPAPNPPAQVVPPNPHSNRNDRVEVEVELPECSAIQPIVTPEQIRAGVTVGAVGATGGVIIHFMGKTLMRLNPNYLLLEIISEGYQVNPGQPCCPNVPKEYIDANGNISI